MTFTSGSGVDPKPVTSDSQAFNFERDTGKRFVVSVVNRQVLDGDHGSGWCGGLYHFFFPLK